jgi:hypothetical protein
MWRLFTARGAEWAGQGAGARVADHWRVAANALAAVGSGWDPVAATRCRWPIKVLLSTPAACVVDNSLQQHPSGIGLSAFAHVLGGKEYLAADAAI